MTQENASRSETNEITADEKDWRTILFASVLLMMLSAPVFLNMQDDRSLWRMSRHDSTGQALILVIFAWPVSFGLLGVIHGFRKRIPSKGLLRTASVFTSIQALAAAALMLLLVSTGYRARESPLVWLAAASVMFALTNIVRSFFEDGLRRWILLMVSMSLLPVMIVLAMAGMERHMIEYVEQGGWVFLFATTALLPFIASQMFARMGKAAPEPSPKS